MHILLSAIMIAAGVVYMSTQDRLDAERDYELYTTQVCEGHWPNYRNIEIKCP